MHCQENTLLNCLPYKTLVTFALVFTQSQDGDIIAPELTPLKESWSNKKKGEDDEGGSSRQVNFAQLNGQKKAKTRLSDKF